MEGFILIILLAIYLAIKIAFGNHDDPTAKDAKKYREGIELVQQKQYQEAYRYFDQVLKERPKCALAYAYRGKCNLVLDDLYAAIFDCTEAVSFDHCIAEAYLVKGIALYNLEMYRDAFLEFDKAVWYFRNSAEAFRWRALTRERLGIFDKAEADLKRAIELGDELANYYLLRQGKINTN